MFKVQFSTENAAFDDAPASSIAEILESIANLVRAGDFSGTIRDANGNTIGSWEHS